MRWCFIGLLPLCIAQNEYTPDEYYNYGYDDYEYEIENTGNADR